MLSSKAAGHLPAAFRISRLHSHLRYSAQHGRARRGGGHVSDLLTRADVTRAMLCRLLRGQPTVDHHSIQNSGKPENTLDTERGAPGSVSNRWCHNTLAVWAGVKIQTAKTSAKQFVKFSKTHTDQVMRHHLSEKWHGRSDERTNRNG